MAWLYVFDIIVLNIITGVLRVTGRGADGDSGVGPPSPAIRTWIGPRVDTL